VSRRADRIRVLEPDANRRGDLFGRLAGDLFLALGYEVTHLNLQKTGRELDLVARHRTERRIALAECKATGRPIGGADLNKFYGALDGERRSRPEEVQGYFVSLSGFTASALEQEREFGGDRFVALDGPSAVEELVRGRILVSFEQALARVASEASVAPGLEVAPVVEVLGHEIGWLWCIRFRQKLKVTHYALVHAGGELLGAEAEAPVVAADEALGGKLRSLERVGPKPGRRPAASAADVAARYAAYLERECGSITFEGLPADQHAGGRPIRLERLFVPLRLRPLASRSVADAERGAVGEPIAAVFRTTTRLAVLGPPGAGKSTLIKRLAVAYSSAERRAQVADDLPDLDWQPLLVRCRQIAPADRPITEILEDLAPQAEMPELGEDFGAMVREALVTGRALLLVDGLDEISNPSERVGFVARLRTFLATYPTVSMVVTSRPAGFRVVGGRLADVCQHYSVAELSDTEIEQLTVAWHRSVAGGSGEITTALDVARRIISLDRVRRLATSPLLLTTLLLVRRWLGELPRKRSLLYGKAVEVLLMTWNVEAHEQIDADEAIPQLAFVAYTMTAEGVQTVPASRLAALLTQARAQLPEVLGYARIPVAEFVQRVEDRSSVMALVGQVEQDGRLVNLYEFKHLTIQEYLTALALADGFYSGRDNSRSLADVLRARLDDEAWKEVIPLAAVLAGRDAEPLIRDLIASVPLRTWPTSDERRRVQLLGRCLADEPQIAPALVDAACERLGRSFSLASDLPLLSDIRSSRYGARFEEMVTHGYMSGAPGFSEFAHTCAALVADDAGLFDEDVERWLAKLRRWMDAPDEDRRVRAALVAMHVSQGLKVMPRPAQPGRPGVAVEMWLVEVTPALIQNLRSTRAPLVHASCLALKAQAQRRRIPLGLTEDVLLAMLAVWRTAEDEGVQRGATDALAALPLLQREADPLRSVKGEDLSRFLNTEIRTIDPPSAREAAAVIVGYYAGDPWSDAELLELCRSIPSTFEGAIDALRQRLVR
jgi:energy-coupling factor transporter ATP-binding protein EcfA2